MVVVVGAERVSLLAEVPLMLRVVVLLGIGVVMANGRGGSATQGASRRKRGRWSVGCRGEEPLGQPCSGRVVVVNWPGFHGEVGRG